MQVANRMTDASTGNYEAAELMFKAAGLYAEISAMNAENEQRKAEGKSMAYTEEDYQRVIEAWK